MNLKNLPLIIFIGVVTFLFPQLSPAALAPQANAAAPAASGVKTPTTQGPVATTPATAPATPTKPLVESTRPFLSEVVNKVFVKAEKQETPAQKGVKVEKGEAVRTDLESRAEVTFADKTIARIGAMTLVSFDVEKREWNVAGGTMLFSKPKDGKEIKISSGSTTAAITGTTGFVTTDEKGECTEFGLVEGHATLKHKSGKTFTLTSGKKLVLLPGAKLSVESFDVEKMLKTSPFFTDFKATLPGEAAIKNEVDRIKNLTKNPVDSVTNRVRPTIPVRRPF